MKKLLTALACASLYSARARRPSPRDNISAVGSSTVFPFAKVVAERFGRKGNFKAPKLNPPAPAAALKNSVKV